MRYIKHIGNTRIMASGFINWPWISMGLLLHFNLKFIQLHLCILLITLEFEYSRGPRDSWDDD
jgi:hypothetical protein